MIPNKHQVYQSIHDIPKGMVVTGPMFQFNQQLKYNNPGHELDGKTGHVNNILYAPLADGYYQRVRVNTGNYNFIESASRFWLPVKWC